MSLDATAGTPAGKLCTVCKLHQPLTSFHKRKPAPDGLAHKCKACTKAYKDEWDRRNPTAHKEWYARNAEAKSEYWRKWYAENKEKRRASHESWVLENYHRLLANMARRRAAKVQATPAWADQDAIREVYKQARRLTTETGVRHDVDHIYPLQGKTVCGLHCRENLRVVTRAENARKYNRMPEGIEH